MPLEPVAGHGSPQFGPEHLQVRAIDLDPSAGVRHLSRTDRVRCLTHQGARQHERRNTDAFGAVFEPVADTRLTMAATDQMPDPNKALAPREPPIHGSSAAPNGIKAKGEGEWHARKHGGAKRRLWRKIHIGVDEQTLEIRAIEVTGSNVGDAPMLPELLDQIAADVEIASVTADGASRAPPVRG